MSSGDSVVLFLRNIQSDFGNRTLHTSGLSKTYIQKYSFGLGPLVQMWLVPACCLASKILVSKMGKKNLIKLCCAGSRAPARRWPGCDGVLVKGGLVHGTMLFTLPNVNDFHDDKVHQPLIDPGNKLAVLGTLLGVLSATTGLQSPGNRNLDVLDLGFEVQPISPEFRFHLSDPAAA